MAAPPTPAIPRCSRIGTDRKVAGDFMKPFLMSSVTMAMLVAPSSFAQKKATIENVPEISFSSVPNFLKLPAGEYLGESVAVATNSKGHLFVYPRSANTRLFEFDKAGNFVKE